MVDISLPPGTGLGPGGARVPPAETLELRARILEIADSFRISSIRGERTEGRIAGVDQNGTLKIETPRGNITVIAYSKPLPSLGSIVALNVPRAEAGSDILLRVLPQRIAGEIPSAYGSAPTQSSPVIDTRPDVIVSLSPAAVSAQHESNLLRTGHTAILLPPETENASSVTPEKGLERPLSVASSSVLAVETGAVSFGVANERAGLRVAGQSLPAPKPLILHAPEYNRSGFQSSLKFSGSRFPGIVAPALLPLTEKISSDGTIRISLTEISKEVLLAHRSSVRSTEPLPIRIHEIAQPVARVISSNRAEISVPFSVTDTPQGYEDPALLRGIITGHTVEGYPLLSVRLPGASFIRIYKAADPGGPSFPEGTQVLFSLAPSEVVPSGLPENPFSLPVPGGAATNWPVFEEIYQVFQQALPDVTNQIARKIPNPAQPHQLPAAALFFIAAAKAGNIASWMGPDIFSALRSAGRTDLPLRLGQELDLSARDNANVQGREWRLTPLPLFWQGDIHRAFLYYRGGDEKGAQEENSNRKQATRFIFDLHLPRMGPLQLDGFHHPGHGNSKNPNSKGKGPRVDLILRTLKAPGEQMRRSMRRSYAEALSMAGLSGELSFQDRLEPLPAVGGREGIQRNFSV